MALGWRGFRSAEKKSPIVAASMPRGSASQGLGSQSSAQTISYRSTEPSLADPPMGSMPVRPSPIMPPDGVSLKGYTTLCRMARFGANLADAHSCFVFFPTSVIGALDPGLVGPQTNPESLILSGFHSLSPEVLPHCEVSRSSGLIGWVATHSRAIHVSPFELDSRTLGIYSSDQQLKSFIGLPIVLQDPFDMLTSAGIQPDHLVGVLACDSKKSFAFSKLQGKLLEDLSREIAATVELLIEQQGRAHPDVAWHSFLRRSSELARSISVNSLEIVRIVVTNFCALERASGTSAAIIASEQLFRIVRQVLPPHFPAVRLINGDIIMAFDNMMTSFYESRIRAVCSHQQSRAQSRSPASPHGRFASSDELLSFEFIKAAGRDRRRKDTTIEELVQSTGADPSHGTQRTSHFGGHQGAGQGVAERVDHDRNGTNNGRGTVVRLEREVHYGNRRG